MSAWKKGLQDFFRPSRVSVGGVTLADVINAPFFRLATLTAIAGTLGFFIGSKYPNVSATTAAITAVVSMRHTFHESIREGVMQVVGVLVGAFVAFTAIQTVGFNSIIFLFSIASCFFVARLFRLGEEGAIAIAITTILVLGPYVSSEKIETRLFGVLIGAAIAMVASFFVRRGQPQERALKDGLLEARELAKLLYEISNEFAHGKEKTLPAQGRKWLARAEHIEADVAAALHNAQSAVDGARWSPMIDLKEAQAVLKQLEMTQQTVEAAVNICRELIMAFGRPGLLPEDLSSAVAEILDATADLIVNQAKAAEAEPADKISDDEFQESREKAAADLRNLDETQPLFIGGSILRDAEKIKDILGE